MYINTSKLVDSDLGLHFLKLKKDDIQQGILQFSGYSIYTSVHFPKTTQ